MGAKVWRDVTCIDFVEDKNAKDKVVVIKENGSWSSIGRLGGDQFLSLDGNTTVGSVVHEIGHVLGLFHTMSRYDRDKFIKIVKKNIDIQPIYMGEMAKVGGNYADVYGLTYDYGSVMHYGELSGSINQQPTMIARDPLYQKTMGSDLISFSDINQHYGCNAKCNKANSAECENDGFPHPRNCSICICPSGYGGALCDGRPPGCGEYLVARSEKQSVVYSLGFGIGSRETFDFCNYMITAPEGMKIELEVLSISNGFYESGCPKGGIEVKAQKDQKMTGCRFCSIDGSSRPVVSTSNRLPVILFSRMGTMEAAFTYRYIA